MACEQHKRESEPWKAPKAIPKASSEELQEMQNEVVDKIRSKRLDAYWEDVRKAYAPQDEMGVVLVNTEFAFNLLISMAFVSSITGNVLFEAKIDYGMSTDALYELSAQDRSAYNKNLIRSQINRWYVQDDTTPLMKPRDIASKIAELGISNSYSLEWSSGSQDMDRIDEFLVNNGFPGLVPSKNKRASVYELFKFSLKVPLPCHRLEFVYLIFRPDMIGCAHHSAGVDAYKLKEVTDRIFELCP